MRATCRLFAEIANKRSGQFLIPHAPTGLTGLHTHPFPRPTLISLYNQTLQKLAALPTTSAYRQSAEALTKHRLSIVNAQVPQGYKEWEDKVTALVQQHPETAEGRSLQINGKQYILPKEDESNVDDRTMEAEWNADEPVEERGEGPRTAMERQFQAHEIGEGRMVSDFEKNLPQLPNEPPLTTEQIATIETQIAAGLIEEVIQVAQAELELVDVMAEHQVWEELEEKPAEGQWAYFKRDSKVLPTQSPPTEKA